MPRKFNPRTFNSPENVAKRKAEVSTHHARLTWIPFTVASPWLFSVLVRHADDEVIGAIPPRPNEGVGWLYSGDRPKAQPIAFAIPTPAHRAG